MFDPNSSPRPRLKTFASPKTTLETVPLVAATIPIHDQVSKRAHELYESRGCEHGKDQQDWLVAEREILNKRR